MSEGVTGLVEVAVRERFEQKRANEMFNFGERIKRLIIRRRKVRDMLESVRSGGAIFVGVPRVIPPGRAAMCIGVNCLSMEYNEDARFRYYYATSPDLARILEVMMRKHLVIITQ